MGIACIDVVSVWLFLAHAVSGDRGMAGLFFKQRGNAGRKPWEL